MRLWVHNLPPPPPPPPKKKQKNEKKLKLFVHNLVITVPAHGLQAYVLLHQKSWSWLQRRAGLLQVSMAIDARVLNWPDSKSGEISVQNNAHLLTIIIACYPKADMNKVWKKNHTKTHKIMLFLI